MAVTPVGNPYVESSDLVANYPGASEALAERIDIVGVNPFADSAARATAIPSPTEGMMSSLNDTDAVERYDGATWKPLGGKVLQVLSTTKLDTFSASIAGSAESGNVTGLTVAITPASTSSKILVSGFISLGNDTATYATLYRNDSLLTSGVGATDGSASRVTASTFGANSFELLSTPFSVLDSPASVAALTYSLRLRHGGGGTKTVFVNRPTDGTTSAVYPRTISSITVMEIGA